MVLNPFFQQGSKSEQSLVQSLINEQLKIYGVDVHFMPRKYVSSDSVLREVSASSFEDAYPIEAYIDNFDGYGDNPTMLSKFGIQATNEVTLVISKERFETYISPLMKNEQNVRLSTRPKEGDLIYFPLGDRLFEIKFVEHEKPFYQLQKNYVYQLTCELFRYEDEVITTDIAEIDDNIVDQGYNITLSMVGTAATATAITGIVNGGIRFVQLTNRGNNFTSIPTVAFSAAPSGGTTAVGVATMIDGLIDCKGFVDGTKVQGVEFRNTGIGYTVAPGIAFVGGGGAGVAATTSIGDGVVGVVSVTSGGSGYDSDPLVTFSSPTGSGTTVVATGRAVINSVGIVTEVRVTNAGLGYTSAPIITIADPIFGSTGSYQYNEVVTGASSSTTAYVNSWDATTNVLELKVVSGTFLAGEMLLGSTSGANRAIRTVNTDDIIDPYADNDTIELEADSILDFSESNPFGNP